MFAETFKQKASLPELTFNEYSEIPDADIIMPDFFIVRSHNVRRVLKALRINSGTGPDGMSARILKQCASSLVKPVRALAQRILSDGAWPKCWSNHWIFPLHKKRSKADPKNYRGIHLTPQISKVVERILGAFFQPFFETVGSYGPRQYAYSKGIGHRDALAANILQWLSALERGKRVALYCSDVSGAFDRVPKERLIAKLASTGIHPRLLRVLKSWLADRSAVVIVKGTASTPHMLNNSVFQGTVWGPPLWNVHYQDARFAVQNCGYTETVYADDFNAFKEFEHESDNDIMNDMMACQLELHNWGRANQAIFDPTKEEFVILHRSRPVGNSFKLLGIVFDPKLRMNDAIHKLAVDAGWRLQQLLRSKKFHTRSDLVRLYKAQILSYLEAGTPAIAHAAPTLLEQIDRIQRRFLNEIGLDEVEALEHYGLAPLVTRRAIAMLGMLHKIAHGNAHAQLLAIIPRAAPLRANRWTSTLAVRHRYQLEECFERSPTAVVHRSAFGRVCTFNALPAEIVELPVKNFQRRLQVTTLKLAHGGCDRWQRFLEDGLSTRSVRDFQRCFMP